jgi:hypothetical protein
MPIPVPGGAVLLPPAVRCVVEQRAAAAVDADNSDIPDNMEVALFALMAAHCPHCQAQGAGLGGGSDECPVRALPCRYRKEAKAPRVFPRCVCTNTRRGAFVFAFYSRLKQDQSDDDLFVLTR